MMKKLIISLAVSAFFFAVPNVFAAQYQYYRPITVTSTNTVASGTQNNFPFLFNTTANWLKTTSTNSEGRIQNVNGWDLVFTSSTPTASGGLWTCPSLPHEIESYTSSTGNMIAWFKAPTTTVSQVYYVCYGSNATSTPEASSSVWDANYKGVWHMPNGTTLNATDSTTNGNNGTITNAPATSGEIDGGVNFNSNNKRIQIPFSSSINISSSITMEAWVFPNVSNIYQTVLVRSLGSGAGTRQYGFFMSGAGTGNIYLAINSGGGDVAVNPAWSINAWNHIVVTADGTNQKIYINGTQAYSAVNSTLPGTNGSNSIWFGEEGGTGQNNSNAKMDEFRLSSAARSSSWILTEYNNQNSPSTFYSIEAENVVNTGNGEGASICTIKGPITIKQSKITIDY